MSEAHWERVYRARDAERVSWYEPEPEGSLAAIEAAGLGPDAAIVDVGGGGSRLAGALVSRGFREVTVADVTVAAIAAGRRRNEAEADEIDWVLADVRGHDFGRRFELWHDRALFHFMVEQADRAAYVETVGRSLAPGGQAVIATFGPEGPTECSGLPVSRYDAESLCDALGSGLELLDSQLLLHRTPGGAGQQFLWARLRRR